MNLNHLIKIYEKEIFKLIKFRLYLDDETDLQGIKFSLKQ